jgi:hypothetical protein
MSILPDDEQELFDDIAIAAQILREAMDTKNTKTVGKIRQLTVRAYGILKPYLGKASG